MTNNVDKKKLVKKILSISGIVLIGAVLLVFALGVIFELADPTNPFAIWTKENI